MKTVNRQGIHDFLNSLVAGESLSEQVALLKDIIVDEFCFNGIAEDKNLSLLEGEVHAAIKADPGQKIRLIKEVREKTGLGLKEAKDFVENLTPGHPSFGKISINGVNATKGVITDHFLAKLGTRLNEIAKLYNRPEPF